MGNEVANVLTRFGVSGTSFIEFFGLLCVSPRVLFIGIGSLLVLSRWGLGRDRLVISNIVLCALDFWF